MHINTDLPTFEEVVSGAFDEEVADICAGFGIEPDKFSSRSELYVEIIRVNQLLVVEYDPIDGDVYPDGLVEDYVRSAINVRGCWRVANATFITRLKLAMVSGEIPVNEVEFRDAEGVIEHNEYGSLNCGSGRHPGAIALGWTYEIIRTAIARKQAERDAAAEVVVIYLDTDGEEVECCDYCGLPLGACDYGGLIHKVVDEVPYPEWMERDSVTGRVPS